MAVVGGGAQGVIPSVEPVIPDFSQPGISLPVQYGSVRERILNDPATRLSFNIEQKKAQQQAEELDVKRQTDSALLPTILDDIQKNQDHMEELNQKIASFTEKMSMPAPLRQVAQMGLGDVLGAGLVALGGGQVSDVAGAALKQNQFASDVDYQNRLNQYGATREDNARILQALQQELAAAQAHGQRLEGYQIQGLQQQDAQAAEAAAREEAYQHSDIEKAKDRFQRADNEGEVIQAADDLAKLGHPVTAEAIQAAREAAKLRGRKQTASELSQRYAAIERQISLYGGVTGDTADALDRIVQELNTEAEASGMGKSYYPPVIGGPTWKAKNAEDERAYREKVAKQKAEEFEKTFNLKDKELAAQMANWAANRDFQKQRLANEQTRANAEMLRATNNTGLETLKKNLIMAQAQLAETDKKLAEIAADKTLVTPTSKRAAAKPFYSKRDSLKAKIAGYQAAIDYVSQQSQIDEAGAGTPPASGSDQTYQTPSGRTYRIIQ